MKSIPMLIVVSLIGVTACNTESAESPEAPVSSQSAAIPGDEIVMERVYDLLYQQPSDFFVDERADTPRSYTVHHIKDDSTSYELCVDGMDAAIQLEAADNAQRSVQGLYVETIETERYFEVVRELSYPDSIGNVAGVTSPGFARIFKCDFIDRVGVDRNLRNGYAGTFGTTPLTERIVREFTQYQWQFTFFWPAAKTVLDTYSTELDDSIEHTLVLGLRRDQGEGQCDLIEVVEWTFSADRVSGTIEKDFDTLYTFEAEYADGAARKCDG